MNIFPKIDLEKNIYHDVIKNQKNGYKDPLFDFKTKKIIIKDGKVVFSTGKIFIQQWITLLIETEIEKYNIYKDTKFGLYNLYKLRGHQFGDSEFGISEIRRELKEKISENKKIDVVKDIKITNTFNSINIKVTIILNNEEVISEVII